MDGKDYHLTFRAEKADAIRLGVIGRGEVISVESYGNENLTNSPSEQTIVTKRLWEESTLNRNSRTCSLEINASVGFGASLFAKAEFSIGAAFQRCQEEEERLQTIQENTLEQRHTFEPWTRTKITRTFIEEKVNYAMACKVYLTGYVLVGCKTKVSCDGRSGRHAKWAIGITEVCSDLRHFRDVEDPKVISAADRQKLTTALDQPDVLSEDDGGIYLTVNQKMEKCVRTNANTKAESEPLPRPAHATEAGSSSGANGAQPNKKVTRTVRIARSTGEDGKAVRLYSKADQELEDARLEQDIRFANSVAGDVELTMDCAMAHGGGTAIFRSYDYPVGENYLAGGNEEQEELALQCVSGEGGAAESSAAGASQARRSPSPN